MSEASRSETPKEQVISGLVRRQDKPRFLRERVTQEDLDALTYDHGLYRHADDSQTAEMLDQETREIERLTGRRLGPTAGEVRRMQESAARVYPSERKQG